MATLSYMSQEEMLADVVAEFRRAWPRRWQHYSWAHYCYDLIQILREFR